MSVCKISSDNAWDHACKHLLLNNSKNTKKFHWHCHRSRSALCLTLNLLQQFQEQENKDDQTFYGQEIKKWTESTIAEIKLLARDKHMLN